MPLGEATETVFDQFALRNLQAIYRCVDKQ